MAAIKKVRVTVWVAVVAVLVALVLLNLEEVTINVIVGKIQMYLGLAAVLMLVVGFAVGFFYGRASVKD